MSKIRPISEIIDGQYVCRIEPNGAEYLGMQIVQLSGILYSSHSAVENTLTFDTLSDIDSLMKALRRLKKMRQEQTKVKVKGDKA